MTENRNPEELRNAEEPPTQIISGAGIAAGRSQARAMMQLRSYLSHYHIRTAALFARRAALMETEHASKAWGELHDTGAFAEHRAYVTGAIFAAVTFLEATINELFADAADEQTKGPVDNPRPDARALMANMWRVRSFREGFRTLEKFQAALGLVRQEQFSTGTQPYQDAFLLTKLRNRLIHFQPEWIPAGEQEGSQAELHTVEKELRGKFAPNALRAVAESGNPFYPDKCLSHGCAKWAVERSLAFVDEFYSRTGIPPRHDPYRPFETD